MLPLSYPGRRCLAPVDDHPRRALVRTTWATKVHLSPAFLGFSGCALLARKRPEASGRSAQPRSAASETHTLAKRNASTAC
jgi:hypothetical protein